MARQRSEWDTLHPELVELFKKTGPPPTLRTPTRETVPKFRQAFLKGRQRYDASPLIRNTLPSPRTWSEHDNDIPVRDGTSVRARVYLPAKATDGGSPAVVFFHGGGWFMGDLDTEAHDCRVYCAQLNVVVISVEYGLFPDVDFPTPVTDCYDAVRYIATNHRHLGNVQCRIDLRRGFVLAGSSGGGTWASVICHLARNDRLDPPLTGCHLTCPCLSDEVFDPTFTHGSRIFGTERNASWDVHADAILQNKKMQRAIRGLANFPGRSELLSPFHTDSHEDVPPTYVQVCGMDPWRDGGIIYTEELAKVGVQTKLKVYAGLPHNWWATFPMLKVSKTRFDDMVEGMRWLLERGSKSASARL